MRVTGEVSPTTIVWACMRMCAGASEVVLASGGVHTCECLVAAARGGRYCVWAG
jgi:hypothetical protein